MKTPSLSSDYLAWRDESEKPHRLVVQMGKTTLSYQLRCIDDLHAMLREYQDWMPLGVGVARIG